MHKDKIKQAIPLGVALPSIKANRSMSFIWFPVKNRKGSFMVLGGRYNVAADRLELKAYIPNRSEKGKIQIYENDFIRSDFALGFNVWLHNNDGINYDNETAFLKVVRNFDYKTQRFENEDVEWVEVVTSSVCKLVKIK